MATELDENTVRQPFAINCSVWAPLLDWDTILSQRLEGPACHVCICEWERNRDEPGLVAPTELAL